MVTDFFWVIYSLRCKRVSDRNECVLVRRHRLFDLSLSGNRVSRTIRGPMKGEALPGRKHLRKEGLRNLFSSSDIN
jgi:hypothetical protein